MTNVHVPIGIAQAARDHANELLEEFTKRKIPLGVEVLQMWSSLRDARDNFFIAVTTQTVTLRVLLRLKCAIQKSERFLNRYCPA